MRGVGSVWVCGQRGKSQGLPLLLMLLLGLSVVVVVVEAVVVFDVDTPCRSYNCCWL